LVRFGKAVSEKKILETTNLKQEFPVSAMFLMDQNEMSNLYSGYSGFLHQ
jgi:hypothetical protein